ncbi:MAG: hypothetical protein ACRCYR_03640 [Phycicoccus sp.]
MALRQTDDAARNQRFLYLGPKGYRWPAATIPTYVTFAVLLITGATLVGLSGLFAPIGWILVNLFVTAPTALVITRRLFRYVDTTHTVRYYRDTITQEIRAPRPPAAAPEFTARIAPSLFTPRKEQP